MTIRVALAGNPNSGKTTLFNRLTGARQRVGNWPGVTIDHKVGKIRGDDAEIVDLPGIYSLSPYSPEESITRNYIINENPDVVLNIVDASNLERNLYLTMQIADMGVPVVVALNMMDVVEERGESIDVKKLESMIKMPIIPISALRGEGIDELIAALNNAAENKAVFEPVPLVDDVEELAAYVSDTLKGHVPEKSTRWYAFKVMEHDEEIVSQMPNIASEVEPKIRELEEKRGDEIDSIVADARYKVIEGMMKECMNKGEYKYEETFSEKVDKIVIHRIWGFPIFVAIIGVMFIGVIGFSLGDFANVEITGVGTYFTDLLNGWIEEVVQPGVEDWCVNNNVSPELTGLLVNGIIAGVGAVLGFLPQMLILFVVMILLEEIGYMARAAFIMDRIFRFFGLSGKSFIPLLVGAGCGVPGIMSSRTIESDRDRRITAITTTFIPCGAKLPIISLIAGSLFGQNGLLALFCYFFGIFAVLLSGLILQKFRSFAGKPVPFIMELPPYHVPSWINVVKGTFDRGWAFVKKAGTFVLLSAIVIWFFASYDASFHYLGAEAWEGSMLASFGNAVCGIFAPLGWGDNWQLTVASISGLVAKENLVGTLGQLLSGADVSESGEEIWVLLREMLTPAAGISFLIFNLICVPCFAAVGALHRELGSWRDTGIAALYQCLFAYGLAAILYVLCSIAWGQSFEISGAIIAVIAIVAIALAIIRPDLKMKKAVTAEASE